MTHSEFERAWQFFAGSFHEDWDLEANNPDGVIFQYLEIAGHNADYLIKLCEEINVFMNRFEDDKALEEGLWRILGAYYVPSADNMTARAWLEHVITMIRKKADSIAASESG